MRLTLMCCTENDNKYTWDVEDAVPYADQDILTNVGAPFGRPRYLILCYKTTVILWQYKRTLKASFGVNSGGGLCRTHRRDCNRGRRSSCR